MPTERPEIEAFPGAVLRLGEIWVWGMGRRRIGVTYRDSRLQKGLWALNGFSLFHRP